jgi:hypothetical protein
MVGIAVELDHEPPVYPDQIDLGARAAHRIDEPVEAEQCGREINPWTLGRVGYLGGYCPRCAVYLIER